MKKFAFMIIAAMALNFVACNSEEKKEENKDDAQKTEQPAEGQQAPADANK